MRAHRKTIALEVEQLEARVAPAVVNFTWTNADKNNKWEDADNWKNDGNVDDYPRNVGEIKAVAKFGTLTNNNVTLSSDITLEKLWISQYTGTITIGAANTLKTSLFDVGFGGQGSIKGGLVHVTRGDMSNEWYAGTLDRCNFTIDSGANLKLKATTELDLVNNAEFIIEDKALVTWESGNIVMKDSSVFKNYSRLAVTSPGMVLTMSEPSDSEDSTFYNFRNLDINNKTTLVVKVAFHTEFWTTPYDNVVTLQSGSHLQLRGANAIQGGMFKPQVSDSAISFEGVTNWYSRSVLVGYGNASFLVGNWPSRN